MIFSAIVISLGSSLAKALFDKSMEKTADTILSKTVAKAKEKLEKKLKLGKYQVIQRALTGARTDVLKQCQIPEQRRHVTIILDGLLKSNADPLLAEISTQVTQIYLLPAPNSPPIQPLARLYRNLNGSSVILDSGLSEESALNNLFDAFFMAFRERLLREPDFAYLREYFQLTEARQQTTLQQAMLERLDAIAANTAQQVEDLTAVRQDYRDYLVKEFKDHVIRGFAPQVGGRVISLPLAKIFLPLQATEGRPALAEYADEDLRRQAASEVMGELDWQRRREEMEKRYAQLSARQAAQRSLKLADLIKSSRSVLLGDPGTGKTTVTRYITYALASDDATHTGTSVRGLTPVLIRIANYAKAYERDSTLHLIEYVEKELTPRPEFGRYLRYEIESGECLIILDGLDEVTNPSLRIQVTDRIQEMVASFSANRYMVTSRIVGYDVSPLTREFKHATLRELTAEDRERFVRLWYDAIKSEISESTHAEGADDLIEALRTKPQIARMGANPLLLTIMVLMHWRGVKLPSRRVQVYQIATDTLIEYWTVQRGITELDAEEIKAILAPIAHYILSSNVGGVIAHHDLLPRFYNGIAEQRGCDQNEAKRIGQKLLKDLSEQSGLFLERGRDDNDQPVYGFLHQTFGEYLAALHLAQKIFNDTFDLKDYIHRSMWYESLLLLAGHLSIVSPTHVNTLIRNVLDFPSLYEDMLQRNLLLAASCLADDVQVKPDLRDEVLKNLADLLQHIAPQICEAALEHYERLAVTRHREAAAVALKNGYLLNEAGNLSKVSDETRLNLATALVHLDEMAAAQPILWQLEKIVTTQSIGRYVGEKRLNPLNKNQIQRLRFKGWPEQSAEYLLQIQAKKDDEFSITAESDLSNSIVGPVSAEQAQRVLGEVGLHALIDALLGCVKNETDQAALHWIAALASKTPSLETFVSLTAHKVPAKIRYLAANRLLDSQYRSEAISVLHDLVKNEAEQAAAAALTLLEAGEAANLDWQLLRDTSLMINNDGASEAIVTLLKGGATDFALPAALYLLSSFPHQESWKPDNQFRSIVETLVEHGHHEIGLTTARWLALRPGYRHRLGACEILLGAGRIEQIIPLLQYLAYECHDNTSHRACQRLLMFKEAERVVHLLNRVSHLGGPKLRYLACQALALANCAPLNDDTLTQTRSELKVMVWNDHMEALQIALQNFCQAGFKVLDALEPKDEQARSVRELARLSLECLSETYSVFDDANELNKLLNSPCPAISVNAALFDLRFGRVDRSQQLLVKLLTQINKSLSSPVRLQALTILAQIGGPETVAIFIDALKDKDSNVRQIAARTLGPLGDSAAIQYLIAALKDDDKEVRAFTIFSLCQLGDSSVTQTLISILNNEDEEFRSAIVYALGEFGDSSNVQFINQALNDKAREVRKAAVYALENLGDSVSVKSLISALTDEDMEIRASAARTLGNLKNPSAVQALYIALNDEDERVCNAAAWALRQLDVPPAIKPLINALSDNNNKVRCSAASILGELEDVISVQYLINMLSDDDYKVRRAAANALGKLNDTRAVYPLIIALSDEDSSVRCSAAIALGKLGELNAVDKLIAALSDENDDVRKSAAKALGEIGTQIAMPALIIALSDENSQVCDNAARALGELGDLAVVQPLLGVFKYGGSRIQQGAVETFGQLGDTAVMQFLMAALIDQEGLVQSRAAEALGRLGVIQAIPLLMATSSFEYSGHALHYTTALIHLAPNSALQVLNRYAKQFRRKSWVERFRGHTLWKLNDIDGALTNFNKAAEKEDNTDNLLALAHFYLEQAELDKAEEYVKLALKKHPRDALYLLSHAVILWHKGEAETALEKLKQAQQRNRRIARIKDLQYKEFWESKAVAALEAMLARTQK
jgi:HEAT repeat protein/DNA replication protein DnaC